jgi:hypothetical protein
MIKVFKLLAFFATLTFQSFALAQSLWGGTEYGMSPSQVRAQYPKSEFSETPGALHGGAKGLLMLPGIEIVNKKFTAIFYFKDEKLEQVVLSCEKQPNFDSAFLVFVALANALRSKYGQEISKDVRRDLLNQANAVWLSGKTNISMIATGVADNAAVLNVNYQVRISKDADKL